LSHFCVSIESRPASGKGFFVWKEWKNWIPKKSLERFCGEPGMNWMSTSTQKDQLIQVALLLLVIGTFSFTFMKLGVFSRKPDDGHTVLYRIDGTTSTAVVAYTQTDGSASKPQTVGIPWQKQVTFNRRITAVLTATNPSQVGKINCIIKLDGKFWKIESAEIPVDRVSCAGIVP
jgi:hypothetical protein